MAGDNAAMSFAFAICLIFDYICKVNNAPHLTLRQRRFCEEYMVDLNAQRAAATAGYSNYTDLKAQALLELPAVKEYIALIQEHLRQRTGITREMLLRELMLIAFSNMSDYVSIVPHNGESVLKLKNTTELTPEQLRCIQSITRTTTGIQIKLHDKIDAIEKLGRHLGLFTPRAESQTPEATDLDEPYILLSNGTRIPI